MMKRISLKDIAEQVGVSTALVSYVLNNKKEGRISKMVAQKIRETAKKLNYRTNQIAKSLKTNRTFTLGLIVADISNPFSSTLARIIEDEADKIQYTVIFGSSDENAQKFDKLINTFLNRQVDGLIISAPDHSEEQILYLMGQGIPFVLLDRYFPSIPTNYIALDNRQASIVAVDHLIKTGRRKIGMISYDTTLHHLLEREEGYKQSLKKNGIPLNEHWLKKVQISNTRENMEKVMDELLAMDEPIDGLLFASNTIASVGLRYLNTLEIKVPEELAVISYDETEALDLFYSPLIYIRQPLSEMGQKAVELLLKNLDGETTVQQLNLPAELIIRASTIPK
jgi:LacI family transcriptional regulator